MSTQRSAPPKKHAPSRKLRRRERLQLSMQHSARGSRPPLPRWGPELEDDESTAEQPASTSHASVNRAGLWVGGILTRVGERRRDHLFGASWSDAVVRLLPRRSPFNWRERDWRGSAWGQRARFVPVVAALLVMLVISGAFAITLATHAASVAQTQVRLPAIAAPSAAAENILRPLPANSTATPTAPQYLIGVWTSSASLPAAGSVKVFVRITKGVAPVAHVRVSLWVDFPSYSKGFGPSVTDADGVAIITITYGGLPPNYPVYVTANATISGQKVSTQSVFVPQ